MLNLAGVKAKHILVVRRVIELKRLNGTIHTRNEQSKTRLVTIEFVRLALVVLR